MTRPAGRERGTAGIEMVGLLPLVLIAGMLTLQAGAAMWTASTTSEAARSAARAYSLGLDARGAAEGSLPGSIKVVSVTLFGPEHGVRLTTEVPRVSPLPAFRVTRQVIMP
jgi:hypothetical protein